MTVPRVRNFLFQDCLLFGQRIRDNIKKIDSRAYVMKKRGRHNELNTLSEELMDLKNQIEKVISEVRKKNEKRVISEFLKKDQGM